jgi:hypothetical protein
VDLRGFLAHADGDGFLATINEKGEVDVAPADRPRFESGGLLRFERIDAATYRNLLKNPGATYVHDEGGYRGVRAYLEKTSESLEGPQRDPVRARAEAMAGTAGPNRHVVHFRVIRCLPLASADRVG